MLLFQTMFKTKIKHTCYKMCSYFNFQLCTYHFFSKWGLYTILFILFSSNIGRNKSIIIFRCICACRFYVIKIMFHDFIILYSSGHMQEQHLGEYLRKHITLTMLNLDIGGASLFDVIFKNVDTFC